MPCKINLRHDQHSDLIYECQQDGITIYAPSWVEKGLQILEVKLHGIEFNVYDSQAIIIDDTFAINSGELSLIALQKIARNEPRNVTGVIKKSNYKPDIEDDSIIYALKDLVRQCIIVGSDETTHFGGYGCKRVPQQIPVYVVDLIGLQFQEPWNTGRLVLYEEKQVYSGQLDELIFENVVGEPKKSYEEVELEAKAKSGITRFLKVGERSYFDAFAYRKFVSTDLILCLLGLSATLKDQASTVGDSLNEQQIHFKFLKYGCGYFGGSMCETIRQHILEGVIDGLETCFAKHSSPILTPNIKSFEFPFFQDSPPCRKRLHKLTEKYGLQFKFSHSDALEFTPPPTPTTDQNYIMATTNCADPHAALGNEMGFESVDSAIAENLKSKGNIFNPLLNKKIESKFVQL